MKIDVVASILVIGAGVGMFWPRLGFFTTLALLTIVALGG